MRKKLLSILLILALLLTACGYMVVEDSDKVTIGSAFGFSAYGEEETFIEIIDLKDDETIVEEETPLTLKSGMKGEEVKNLQYLLRKYGFMNGRADGIFGTQTETGVENAVLVNQDIFSLETLTVDGHVKKGVYVPSHLHFNVTYLAEADENASVL